MFRITGIGGVAPFESPVGFVLNAWHCFDGVKQVHFFCWILDVHVNEEGERLAVDVFDCDLEAVEASGFGRRYFGGKMLLRFLLTMPLEAAKNTRTWEMKWCSVSDSLSQSVNQRRRQFLPPSRKKLRFFYTSARCQHGVWGRAQSNVGSPAVMI